MLKHENYRAQNLALTKILQKFSKTSTPQGYQFMSSKLVFKKSSISFKLFLIEFHRIQRICKTLIFVIFILKFLKNSMLQILQIL